MARRSPQKWSQEATDRSNARDSKDGVFQQKDPKRIAASLKDSAEHSERPKADPYRSAMSQLTHYSSRTGAHLKPEEKDKLEKTKDELRDLYHRPASGRTTPPGRRVEKPGSGKQAGPSGQKDKTGLDGRHANK